MPWKDRTLVGTHYAMADGTQMNSSRRRQLVAEFLQLINAAAAQWSLRETAITFVHWGELPVDSRSRPGESIRLRSHVEIIDGGARQAAGLWLISGPKFTTALEAAGALLWRVVKGLEPVVRRAGQPAPCSPFMQGLMRMDKERDVSAKAELAARALHARHLEDVVLRRTGCGSGGYPGRSVLEACASGMARALYWSEAVIAAEIAAVEGQYRERHLWRPHEAEPETNMFLRSAGFSSRAYVP